MSTIFEVAERVARLDLLKECQIAIGQTSKEMIKAQQKQRWDTGEDGKGRRMKPYKSAVYRELKIEAGHNDVTDLNLTGATDAKMFVDVNGDEFEINSSGPLVSKLEDKYGPDIYGLNENHIGAYIEKDFFPQLKNQIEKITGLEMK